MNNLQNIIYKSMKNKTNQYKKWTNVIDGHFKEKEDKIDTKNMKTRACKKSEKCVLQ